VNQVFNMTNITRRHISSVNSLQASMISALNSITVCRFFREIFSLRNPHRKQSCGFKSGLFGGQFCPYAKRSGNLFQMTCESKMSRRKSKTTFAVCGLAPSCMNHCVLLPKSSILKRIRYADLRNQRDRKGQAVPECVKLSCASFTSWLCAFQKATKFVAVVTLVHTVIYGTFL
jgi:hypothetical protein